MNIGASEGTDTNDPNVSSDVHGEPKLVIWGTDVVVAETKSNFRKFIMSFMFDHEADESQNEYDPSRPYYIQKMEEIAGKQGFLYSYRGMVIFVSPPKKLRKSCPLKSQSGAVERGAPYRRNHRKTISPTPRLVKSLLISDKSWKILR